MRSTAVLLTLLLLLFSSRAHAAPGEVITDGEPLAGRTLSIVVFKADRRLEVRDGDTVLRRYAAGLGFAPDGDKVREGDGKTPEGSFSVVRRLPKSSYYKAFLIDYPDPDDAERGVKDGIISASTAQKIRAAHADGKVPPQYSDLGGLIEIHGMGGTSDWTLGCVAIDNSAVDAIWPHIKVGTKVVIRP
jgi:murein L,D-transpeptidase YafK